jgi:hypothetical protein
VSADGGYSALGRAVHTVIIQARSYLPVLFRQR